MRASAIVAVVLVGCGGAAAKRPVTVQPGDETVAVAAPPVDPVVARPRDPKLDEPVVALFERVLPRWGYRKPLVAVDGTVGVDGRLWDAEGHYLGPSAIHRGGQLEPIGLVGTGAAQRVVAMGWGQLYTDDTAEAWLVTGDPHGTIDAAPHHPVTATFDPDDQHAWISPSEQYVALLEGDGVTIRDLATGAALASAPIANADARICWAGDTHAAYFAGAGWTTLAAQAGALPVPTAWHAPAPLACDPAGGAAAIRDAKGGIATIDLATGSALGLLDGPADVQQIAIADHGARLATTAGATISVYGTTPPPTPTSIPAFASRFTLAWDPAANPANDDGDEATVDAPNWSQFFALAFSRDGTRLAIVGDSLLVLGPASAQHAAPAKPELDITLPRGFARTDGPAAISWPSVPAPSGALSSPARLLHAESDFATATITVLDADEFRDYLPSPSADQARLRTWALFTMRRLSDLWDTASLDGKPTKYADFTISAAHNDKQAWADTREILRDGCEPYDGYTRLVYDRELGVIFVVQGITVPGGPIASWLSTFLDAPFHLKPRVARVRGPGTGPC